MILVSHGSRGLIGMFLGPKSGWHVRLFFSFSTFISLYTAFLPLPTPKSIMNQPYWATLLLNKASDKESKMSRNTFDNSTNCQIITGSHNTTNNNVSTYYTIGDDLSPLLTWLSPLDPGLRHSDIQERRVSKVGEWLMKTEEFNRWCRLYWRSEDDKAVLFCYGNPGVGKTFIR